jgi:hypothetical protein
MVWRGIVSPLVNVLSIGENPTLRSLAAVEGSAAATTARVGADAHRHPAKLVDEFDNGVDVAAWSNWTGRTTT